MSIRTRTCYEAVCDTPGCTPWDDADGTPHWDSAEQAIAQVTDPDLYGWTHDDGVLRCSDCADAYRCEQDGHQWTHWDGDPTLQLATEHCGRCGETRLLATQAN